MRNAFIEELSLAAQTNSKIALIVGDLGYGVVEDFAKRFPKQFFNAGVAEQNMMGLAAGMASEGYHVFCYSIANFPTFRCAEQIRNDVDYHNLPVTTVAVGGGLAYGNLGYSHHAVQDYALMRSMPNMLIAAPGDPMEVRACVRYLLANPQPSYLRIGKAGEPCLHKAVPTVSPGQWLHVLGEQSDTKTYLTTGATLDMTWQLLQQANSPKRHSLKSMPLWSLQSKTAQLDQISAFEQVITVEDHFMDGGFGSWMLEAATARPELLNRIKIKSLSPVVAGMVAKQKTMNEAGGLTQEALCA
jgi:transketolase